MHCSRDPEAFLREVLQRLPHAGAVDEATATAVRAAAAQLVLRASRYGEATGEGSLSVVEEAFTLALRAFERVGPSKVARETQARLAAFYLYHHLPERAEPLLSAPGGSDVGTILLVADGHGQAGRPNEALSIVAPLLDRSDLDPLQRAYADTIAGNALLRLGRRDEAANAFRRVVATAEERLAAGDDTSDTRARIALGAALLGSVELARGNQALANDLFERSARVIEEGQLALHVQMSHREMWGNALMNVGFLEEASERYEEARELFTRLHESVADPADRERYLGVWLRIDARVVELALLHHEDPRRALDVVENGKTIVMREIARLHAPAGPLPPDSRARGSERERAAAARVEAAAALEPAPLTAGELLGVLPGADWSLVSLYSADRGTALLLASGGEIEYAWLADWTYQRLERELLEPWNRVRERASDGLVDPALRDVELRRLCSRLAETLWVPVAEWLDRKAIRRLVVSPHRGLHIIPFAAVHEHSAGGATLDELVVVPGLAFAAALRADPRTDAAAAAAIVGRPDEGAPMIGWEALAVADGWSGSPGGVRLAVGREATPRALYESARGAALLHVASHGSWRSDDIWRSGLNLSPLPPGAPTAFGDRQGVVNVAAILAQLDLRACELAVLAACESGLSRESWADEPVSLPLALLMVGARQVVASLWTVSDAATLLVMRELHERLRAGETPAAALAAAQRRLRSLSPTQILAELKASRAAADALPRSLELAAQEQLAQLDDAFRAADGEARPYDGPEYWGAFACWGLPAG